MFLEKVVQEIKTHFLFIYFHSYNVEKYGTAGEAANENIIQCMRFVCWITEATDTRSEYVILAAFLWQQLFRERALLLRNKYIACTVCSDYCGI
jgi:hypothetical protein